MAKNSWIARRRRLVQRAGRKTGPRRVSGLRWSARPKLATQPPHRELVMRGLRPPVALEEDRALRLQRILHVRDISYRSVLHVLKHLAPCGLVAFAVTMSTSPFAAAAPSRRFRPTLGDAQA